MWPFKKSCEHNWDIIEKNDIYSNISIPVFSETTYSFNLSEKLEQFINEKGMSKTELIIKLKEIIEFEINKAKRGNPIGKFFLKKCTKCGKIEPVTCMFDPIQNTFYSKIYGE